MAYKERLRQLELKTSNDLDPLMNSSNFYHHSSSTRNSHEQTNSLPILTMNEKFPLPMLLCLLADGRQLTLDEIDRILVYLLEKKAKMLTLPPGTLPPLPAQYATKTSTNYLNGLSPNRFFPHAYFIVLFLFLLRLEKTSPMTSNGTLPPKSDITTDRTLPTVIAEQIRHIITTNLAPVSNGSTDVRNMTLESIPNLVKTEQTINSNPRDINGDYSQSLPRESHLSSSNNGTLTSSFHPSPQALTSTVNPFHPSAAATAAFPSFNPLNPSLKPVTATNSNPLTQASDYLYSLASTTNLYPLSINTSQTDAFYQTYSQLNSLPMLTAATLNQQMLRPLPSTQPTQTKQET